MLLLLLLPVQYWMTDSFHDRIGLPCSACSLSACVCLNALVSGWSVIPTHVLWGHKHMCARALQPQALDKESCWAALKEKYTTEGQEAPWPFWEDLISLEALLGLKSTFEAACTPAQLKDALQAAQAQKKTLSGVFWIAARRPRTLRGR